MKVILLFNTTPELGGSELPEGSLQAYKVPDLKTSTVILRRVGTHREGSEQLFKLLNDGFSL